MGVSTIMAKRKQTTQQRYYVTFYDPHTVFPEKKGCCWAEIETRDHLVASVVQNYGESVEQWRHRCEQVRLALEFAAENGGILIAPEQRRA